MSDDLRAAQRGDEAAFARLVEAHAGDLFRFARRLARDDGHAEDLVQETFMRVHRHLATLDPTRPLRPWLLHVAYTTAISQARYERRRPKSALGEHEPAARGHAPEGAAVAAEVRERVLREVDALPPKYRALVAMYHLEERDLGACAEALGIPLGTAKVRLFRARKLLAGRLAHLWEGDEMASATLAGTDRGEESGDA